jgi:hypothetical protein
VWVDVQSGVGARGLVGEQGAEDDVGDPAAQQPQRLGSSVAALDPAVEVLAAERGTAAWVMAMRCSAALTWRLPERVSRKQLVLPDQTGCGAVPFQRA